jgi:uncharacterized DUF497 family protein
MGGFTWSVSKNASLRQERQVSFEKLVQSVECGGLIADQEDFARPGQRRLAIFYDSYAWVVPYVAEQDGTKFLKMAYPSRKLFKRYCDDKKLPSNLFKPLDTEERLFMEADEEKGWVDSNLHTQKNGSKFPQRRLKRSKE